MQPQHDNVLRLSRRAFLRGLGAATCWVAAPSRSGDASRRRLRKTVTVGVLADLHQDVMHDGEARLDAFLAAMTEARPDAILQLGDFAYPNPKNRAVIDAFNKAHRNALHVIGNHDTDSGHTVQQCLDVWGMPGRYYSRDIGGLRILALDGNDKGSPARKGGYASFVGPSQIEWLEAQLKAAEGPVMIASHQPLAGYAAVDNAVDIQGVLGRYADRVALAVNGHSHLDSWLRVSGVPYFHVNSASYYWVGGAHKHESYPKEVHAAHPWISHTCPYRDALFAVIAFDPEAGAVGVAGRYGEWVGVPPEALGVKASPGAVPGEEIVPCIRTRRETSKVL